MNGPTNGSGTGRGSSLVEVLVAMALVLVLVVGTADMLTLSLKAKRRGDVLAGITHAVSDRLDGLRARPYEDRVDNMLFTDGDSTRLVIIDWQYVMRCRHGWDLAYLLGTNLEPELRRRNADGLKDRYYAALLRHGVRGYSRADLDLDVALGTLGMTANSVFGGANVDFAQPRSVALQRAMAHRSFSAVLDDDCLAVLP